MNKKIYLLISLSLIAFSNNVLSADESAKQDQYQSLFQQADFWITKQRPNLAKDALQRILLSDPNNLKALYQLAVLASKSNKDAEKAKYVKEITRIDPDSPYLSQLKEPVSNNSLLDDARALSSKGEYLKAIKRYQKAFNGSVPPDAYAIEYYQTLAGTHSGVAKARHALAELHRKHPENSAFTIAYGKVLTYDEATRRQGISLLTKEEATHPEVEKNIHQALLWLGAKASDSSLYHAYLKKHPRDTEVALHFKKATAIKPAQRAANDRVRGYKAYKNGQDKKALSAFESALKHNRRDASAIAGIGLVKLRQGRFEQAYRELDKAIKQSPTQANQWTQARDSAHFYASLNEIKEWVKQGHYKQALSKLDGLQRHTAKQDEDALLTKAQILQKQHKLSESFDVYSRLLSQHSSNLQARIGLINILQSEGKWGEANVLAQTLPAASKAMFQRATLSKALALKNSAEAQPTNSALSTLRQASSLAPSNPWIRLDLARTLNHMGKPDVAESILSRGIKQYGTATDRYVAALLAQDQKRWSNVLAILKPIAIDQQDKDIKQLKERASLQLSLARIKQRQNVGDEIGARKLISTLYQSAPNSVVDEGNIASTIYQSGQADLALSYLQAYPPALDQPVKDYRGMLTVMAKAGDQDGANQLLQKLSKRQSLTDDDKLALDHIQNDLAIIQADTLRKDGQLAQSYEVLADRMRAFPDNLDLLLAMGRLYRTGQKEEKAGQIYQYVLQEHPRNIDAVKGLVSTQLSLKKTALAQKSINSVPKAIATDPEILLLKARVAAAIGNNSDALTALSQAKNALQVNQSKNVAGSDIFASKNPFLEERFNQSKSKSLAQNRIRPSWLPGRAKVQTVKSDSALPPSLSYQVYQLTKDVRKNNATYIEVGGHLVSRSGESGLSRLDRVEAPVRINTAYANGRFQVAVTPTVLSAGGASSNPELFGTNAVFSSTAATPNQSDTGVGLNLSQSWKTLTLDFGVTPLGLQEQHLVGGIHWQPNLTENLALNIILERRAVKDSLLSYAGTIDPTTNEAWGGVDKSGGSLGLSFDNGVLGLYGSAGAYRYQGNGVQSNLKMQTSIGGYFHLVNNATRQLLAGMDVTVMSFDHNVSKYSLGHGGYFSPENYAAFTFPISLSEKHKNVDFKVKFSPGFQSFSEDSAPFYPENASFQKQFNGLVAAGNSKLKSPEYHAETTRGFGLSLSASATYHVNQALSLSFGAGYDNFGNYNRVSAGLTAKYLMGVMD